MNELWIGLGYGSLYFSTNKITLHDAMEEFINKLNSIGCVADNFGWEKVELRDENLHPIESIGAGRPRDIGC